MTQEVPAADAWRELGLAFALLGALAGTPGVALSQEPAPAETSTIADVRERLRAAPGGYTAQSVTARALAVAPAVRDAEYGRAAAGAAADEARAAFVPSVSLTGSYTRLSEDEHVRHDRVHHAHGPRHQERDLARRLYEPAARTIFDPSRPLPPTVSPGTLGP